MIVLAEWGHKATPFMVFMALTFAAFGGYAIVSGLRNFRAIRRRDAYEPVEAEIQSVELASRNSRNGGTTYYPAILYEYSVDGRTYTSESVYPGTADGQMADESTDRDVVEKYDDRDRARAYYDPADPGTSYLEDETSLFPVVLPVVAGLLFVVTGVGVVAVFPPFIFS